MPLYKLTRPGSSHYAKVGGKYVRFNADPTLGRNLIELTEQQAASGKYSHLGLRQAIIMPPKGGELFVATPGAQTAPVSDTPDAQTPPASPDGAADAGGTPPGGTDTPGDAPGHGTPHGDGGESTTEFKINGYPIVVVEALPEDWRKATKSRKAAYVRRRTGVVATQWDLDTLDAFLEAYESHGNQPS